MIDVADGDERVLRLRVKWIGRIRRIGFEAEELPPATSPSQTRRTGIRLEVQRSRDRDEVAESVKHRAATIPLDPAGDMGVVTDDHVGAGVDRGPGHLPFIHGQRRRDVADALVQRDDDHVELSRERGDIGLHRLECVGLGKGVRARRTAR